MSDFIPPNEVPDFDPSVDSQGLCPLPDEAANDNEAGEEPPDGGEHQAA